MLPLIPLPRHVQMLPGQVALPRTPRITEAPALAPAAERLRAALAHGATPANPGPDAPAITLDLDHSLAHPEGYRLRIAPGGVQVVGGGPAGVHHGCTTLLLLAAHSRRTQPSAAALVLPTVEIDDAPRFTWRGLHLDVSRHFFSADQVCRLLDLMALHKFNVLHWHLTDDQGWRLPVRRYPRLTEVGGWREATLIGHESHRPRRYDDQRYGGSYTPEDIRRVVAHAAARHITVVPEIDLPGHMQAAIAAYPELGVTRQPIAVRCHWGISQHILNPFEPTVAFMQHVMDEVAELFPSPFIHIGGDEALKYEWCESRAVQDRIADLGMANEADLQNWFIGRIGQFLAERGRRIIGWDEILEGALPQDTAVMSWRGMAGGIRAAAAGHDVVMAPGKPTYFDHYQVGPEGEPLAIGGMVTLRDVYGFDPIPADLPAEHHARILGGQGQLWSEYLPSWEQVEYMAFPRACALAETLWSPAQQRDWPGFVRRLHAHRGLLDELAVRYCARALEEVHA